MSDTTINNSTVVTSPQGEPGWKKWMLPAVGLLGGLYGLLQPVVSGVQAANTRLHDAEVTIERLQRNEPKWQTIDARLSVIESDTAWLRRSLERLEKK